MAHQLNPHRATTLRQIGTWKTYVYLDPARPGGGISRPTLDRLLRDSHITMGAYEPQRGRLLTMTDVGRIALAAYDEAAAR